MRRPSQLTQTFSKANLILHGKRSQLLKETWDCIVGKPVGLIPSVTKDWRWKWGWAIAPPTQNSGHETKCAAKILWVKKGWRKCSFTFGPLATGDIPTEDLLSVPLPLGLIGARGLVISWYRSKKVWNFWPTVPREAAISLDQIISLHWPSGSYVSGELPTHPSPKPTFCPKWEVMLALGRGRWAGSQKRIQHPTWPISSHINQPLCQ